MATDTSKGQLTGDRILEAAFQLFVKQGFHGTSMRQIASEAGFTPASIYNHFENKEEIFRQVLLRYHPYREIVQSLEAAQGGTVEALVKDAARRVISLVRSRKDLPHLMFIEMVEFNGGHVGELFARAVPQAIKFLDKLQQAQGTLRPIPPESLLITLMGTLISQWMIEGLLSANTVMPLPSNQFEQAVDIYLHGILARQGELNE